MVFYFLPIVNTHTRTQNPEQLERVGSTDTILYKEKWKVRWPNIARFNI